MFFFFSKGAFFITAHLPPRVLTPTHNAILPVYIYITRRPAEAVLTTATMSPLIRITEAASLRASRGLYCSLHHEPLQRLVCACDAHTARLVDMRRGSRDLGLRVRERPRVIFLSAVQVSGGGAGLFFEEDASLISKF